MLHYINEIKLMCDKKKITFKRLAKNIGVSETGLHKMFKKNSMTVNTLILIARELKVPVTYFFTGIDNEQINKNIDQIFDELKNIVKERIEK